MQNNAIPHAEQFLPEFGPKDLANHWPMVQTALTAMQAPKQAFDDFDAAYLPGLDPVDISDGPDIHPGNFDACLGQGQHYAGYYRYFRTRLDQDGIQATLSNGLRHLAPGLITGAFHALIRIGAGVAAQDRAEIAAGLAYMADHYQDTSHLMWQRRVDGQPLAASFKRLVYKINKGQLTAPKPAGDTITVRIQKVLDTPAILDAMQEQNLPDYGGLKGLAESVLAMFLCSRDFTLLHGITSSHALWIIQQHVDEDTARMLNDWFALALVIAWMSTGAKDPADDMLEVPFEFVDEEAIKARAVARHNDHDIKFCWTCFELEQAFDQPLYRQALRLWLNI